MNEKIKQLKAEAFRLTQWQELDYDKILEKIVELTVKECVSVADTYVRTGENGRPTARSLIGIEIKKHFGVEE